MDRMVRAAIQDATATLAARTAWQPGQDDDRAA
jgi:hypothetical protein